MGTGLSIRGAPKCTSVSSWPQNQELSGSACLATFQSASLIRLLISGGWEEGSDYRQNHVLSKFCHLKKICPFTEHLRHIFFFVVPPPSPLPPPRTKSEMEENKKDRDCSSPGGEVRRVYV